MTEEQAPLADRMRELAKTHPAGEQLVAMADALDAATAGFYSEPQSVGVAKFVGTWAKARRFWCDLTGEALI